MRILPIVAALLAFGATAQREAIAGSESGNTMVRVLGTVVDPDAHASVSTGPGADADISTEVIPALTLSYFLNKNVAVELFCCFANHQVKAKGDISALGEIGDSWIFPPAVTLQYHFDGMGAFKPYVGAGVQYIHFFNEKSNLGTMKIDDGFGFTLQAGVDVSLGGGWYLNADVKKTWLDTEASWNGGGITADVDVDPLIISAGVGYRFNLSDLLGARAEALK